MIVGDGEVGVGMGRGARGVDDVLHPGGNGGGDRSGMLLAPGARPTDGVGADDQDAVDAGEGSGERIRIVEIAGAHLDPARRQILELGRIARHRDHTDAAPREQQLDHAPAELAIGTGHQKGLLLVAHRPVTPFAVRQVRPAGCCLWLRMVTR